MASGIPSSRWQMAVIAARSSALGRNDASAARARSTNRSTPSDAGSSGKMGWTRSPGTPSGSRLVANTVTVGQPVTTVVTSSATGASTCSQLSTISSRSPSPQPVDHRFDQRHVALRRDGQRRHDRGRHGKWVGNGRQSDQPHATREVFAHRPPELDRQPCLADAARAGEGHQATSRQLSRLVLQLGGPADELGRRPYQVPRWNRPRC